MKSRRTKRFNRGTFYAIALLAVAMLIIGMFKSCGSDKQPMTLTREDFYSWRSARVNTSATGDHTKNTLNASLRPTVEKMLPQDYEIVDTFSVCYSSWLFDPHRFEHWVLVQTPEGEEMAIVFVMYDENDARLMYECITDSMAKIPSYKAVPARPEDEVAHFYLSIPDDDPVKLFYGSEE